MELNAESVAAFEVAKNVSNLDDDNGTIPDLLLKDISVDQSESAED